MKRLIICADDFGLDPAVNAAVEEAHQNGILSTASLMVGVAASSASSGVVVTAGIAGVAAGAMAMAVGEYVSVSSQADVEAADRAREVQEHLSHPDDELLELAGIYRERGLPEQLAEQVARAFHSGADPVEVHLRDELGHSEHNRARPLQAAIASAACFTVGGLVPFVGLFGHGTGMRLALIVIATLVGLALAGVAGAMVAGTRVLRPALRVVAGGAAAMCVTAGVGQLAHLGGI